jgi:hypothetical protein
MIKLRRMNLVGYVTCIGNMRNVCNILGSWKGRAHFEDLDINGIIL